MSNNKICQLHPQYMSINSDGVEDFFWPVTFSELEAFRDHFLEKLVAWIRSENINNSRDAELTWLTVPVLLREAMRLFNASAFAVRARKKNVSPFFSGNSDLFVPVYEGRWPEKGSNWQRIYAGISKTPKWRQWAQIIKYLLKDSPFKYKPKWALSINSDVMTLSTSPLIKAHARKKKIKLALSNFDDWFTSGSLHGRKLPTGISETGVNNIISLIKETYLECDVELPEFVAAYMDDFINTLGSATEFYLRDVERLSEKLPLKLWTGSMGIYWYRILGRAVQKIGGEVAAHDHGTGTGWYDTYLQTIIEFNYSDSFVVSSDLMAEGLSNSRRADLMINNASSYKIDSLESIG